MVMCLSSHASCASDAGTTSPRLPQGVDVQVASVLRLDSVHLLIESASSIISRSGQQKNRGD